MEYKASLDTLSKLLTAGVFVLLLVMGYRSTKALMAANGDIQTIMIHAASLIVLVVIIGGSFLFAPQKYILTEDSLIIKRFIKDITIRLDEIQEIRAVAADEMSSSIRTFGVGGLFGYYGKYHTPQFGNMTFYATHRNDKVLIKTLEGKKIIITPDDLGLVDEIRNSIPGKD